MIMKEREKTKCQLQDICEKAKTSIRNAIELAHSKKYSLSRRTFYEAVVKLNSALQSNSRHNEYSKKISRLENNAALGQGLVEGVMLRENPELSQENVEDLRILSEGKDLCRDTAYTSAALKASHRKWGWVFAESQEESLCFSLIENNLNKIQI